MPGERLLILTGGQLGVFSSKTAVGVMRCAPDRVAGLLDGEHAGADSRELLRMDRAFPIFSSVADAMRTRPDALLIGVAPQGGRLEEHWRESIREAIRHGLHIYSGLHVMLGEDAEFAALAKKHAVRIWDIRRPPDDLPVAKARAAETRAFRVLTIGTDCNTGKMLASIEIERALRRRGHDARFIATGQTGIVIQGGGIAIDRAVSDFAAGAAERMVLEHKDREFLVVEGQGSLLHPGFSGVTLSLLHGSLPHAVILCHHAGRERVRGSDTPLAPLSVHIELCEKLCAPIFPAKVIAVAVNGVDLDDGQLRAEINRVEAETGLPAADVVRTGPDRLVDAILEYKTKRESAAWR